MLFNVINYSNLVIGQVEADSIIEAWAEAGKKYKDVLDVTLPGEVIGQKYGSEKEVYIRNEILNLIKIVDIVTSNAWKIVRGLTETEKIMYDAAVDSLETAISTLEGASEILGDAEFEFGRPGTKPFGEALREVLEEKEKEEE